MTRLILTVELQLIIFQNKTTKFTKQFEIPPKKEKDFMKIC